jgi:hypothetical protein
MRCTGRVATEMKMGVECPLEKKFNQVQIGMTTGDVMAIMGRPHHAAIGGCVDRPC